MARPWGERVFGRAKLIDGWLLVVAGITLAVFTLGFAAITRDLIASLREPSLSLSRTELHEGRLADFKPFFVNTRDGKSFEGYHFTAEPFDGGFFVPGRLADRDFKIETLTPGTPVSFRVLPKTREAGKGTIEVCEFRSGQGTLLNFADVAADDKTDRLVAPYLLALFLVTLAWFWGAFYRCVRLSLSRTRS